MKPPLELFAKDLPLLTKVWTSAKAEKIKLYLVGGVLRDLFLGRERENPDFDFCLKKGAINFGRNLAKELKAGFVVLDKENGAARLVKIIKDKQYTLDFTDFRGKDLRGDLLLRDFTINSMALSLENIFIGDDLNNLLIDPFGARQDLKNRLIKVVDKKAFAQDPLRILRAFSFSAIFGFKLDKQVLLLAKSERNKLLDVSYERIRDELFKILDTPCAFRFLSLLDKLKILGIVFPEIERTRNVRQGPYHHLDVWHHSLETVRQSESILEELKYNKEIQDYLNEPVSGQRSRRALLKLGAFLHDIGKPQALRREDGKTKFHGHERIGFEITKAIAKRLRLSCDEMESLERMVLWHLRPGYLGDSEVVTERAKFRYFRDTQNEAVSVLLLSIADQRSTRGPLTTKGSRVRHEKTCFSLIKEYFKKKKEKKLIRLINGDDLIRRFKLEPSPLIGKILREIEELQAIGKIKTKPEALKTAAKLVHPVREFHSLTG